MAEQEGVKNAVEIRGSRPTPPSGPAAALRLASNRGGYFFCVSCLFGAYLDLFDRITFVLYSPYVYATSLDGFPSALDLFMHMKMSGALDRHPVPRTWISGVFDFFGKTDRSGMIFKLDSVESQLTPGEDHAFSGDLAEQRRMTAHWVLKDRSIPISLSP
jgi:hypothetical protein